MPCRPGRHLRAALALGRGWAPGRGSPWSAAPSAGSPRRSCSATSAARWRCSSGRPPSWRAGALASWCWTRPCGTSASAPTSTSTGSPPRPASCAISTRGAPWSTRSRGATATRGGTPSTAPCCAASSRHDLLICADGIASIGRAALQPSTRPAYAGYVAWRGTVPEAGLSAAVRELLADSIVYQVMPNSHILLYPIPALDGSVEPGRRLANFVWYRNYAAGDELGDLMTDSDGVRHGLTLPPGGAREPHLRVLRAAASELLAGQLAEVVHRTERPFVQVIFDIEVARMAFGRVCLIGDAAFALRPHAAAGTAKAAADAWALAAALEAARGDVEEALPRWERRQLALGRAVLQRARRKGDKSQFEGTWRPGDPELVFGLYEPGR